MVGFVAKGGFLGCFVCCFLWTPAKLVENPNHCHNLWCDGMLIYEQKSGARWCPVVSIPWIDQPFFNSTLVHENFFHQPGFHENLNRFFSWISGPPKIASFCFWEALIYLTHLDPEHMENLVLQRVAHECLERKDDLERWCPTMLLSQKPLKKKNQRMGGMIFCCVPF